MALKSKAGPSSAKIIEELSGFGAQLEENEDGILVGWDLSGARKVR